MSVPDYYANNLLDKLKITSIKDLQLLELIALERGAVVHHRLLKGAEARIAIVGRKAVITISSSISDPRRRRFSIAHELGHFEMHRRLENVALCTAADLDDWESKRIGAERERDANEFAAALLLPERFFASRCRKQDPSLDLVSALADDFGASLTATAIRFMRFTEEPCAVVFFKDGYSRWFHASKSFRDLGVFVEIHSKPDPSSHIAALYARHITSMRPKQVQAGAWFSSGRFRSDATIIEQSWLFPEYGTGLTLLRADDDIEDLEDDDE